MTGRERIELIERLEAQSERNERRARALGWGSVALAALVLAVLLASGYSRLSAVRKEVDARERELAEIEMELAAKREELARTEARLDESRDLIGVVGQEKVEQAIAQRQESLYGGKPAPPRVYIHIAEESDRAAAQATARQLEAAGYFVPGIELVPGSASLRATELRYAKQADAEAAGRLHETLSAAGAPVSEPKYMRQYEASPRVQPNQFELWVAPGALPPPQGKAPTSRPVQRRPVN